jgi:neutral ceramidase
LRAGFGKVDITPPLGTSMSGYGWYLDRKAEAVLDPLYARCIAVEEGEERVFLIALDLLALSVEQGLDVRERLAREFSVRPDQVLLAAIHTHSGPATWDAEGMGDADPEYMASLPRRIAEAMEDAVADLAPCRVTAGEADVEPIGFNRFGRRPHEVDRHVRGVRFERDGKPILLAHHSCHAVTLGVNRELSADYPGAVCRELARAGYEALFFNGCCGDIDPKVNQVRWGSGTPADVAAYGELLAEALGRVRSVPAGDGGVLRSASRTFDLPLDVPDRSSVQAELDEAEGKLARGPGDGYARFNRAWAAVMLAAIDAGEARRESPFVLQAVDLGAALLIGFSGEIFFGVGERVRAVFPDPLVIPVSCAVGSAGYIPTADAYEAGAYEALVVPKMRRQSPYTADVADHVFAAAVDLIGGLTGSAPL